MSKARSKRKRVAPPKASHGPALRRQMLSGPAAGPARLDEASPLASDSLPSGRAARSALRNARRLAKYARRLLAKHRKKVSETDQIAVDEGIDALEVAVAAGDLGRIPDLEHVLETKVDAVLGFARKSTAREYLESIAIALLVAGLLRAFVVEAFKIPTGSMIPTLAVGDHIFVNKFIYGLKLPFTNRWFVRWSSPQRGDVVVFSYPLDTSTDYIKRVVAVAGDRVRVKGRHVYVNGVPLELRPAGEIDYLEDAEDVHPSHFEHPGGRAHTGVSDEGLGGPLGGRGSSRRRAIAYEETSAERENVYTVMYETDGQAPGSFPSMVDLEADLHGLDCSLQESRALGRPPGGVLECRVLEGYVFTMGDNRDNSSDGRKWGGVPLTHLEGKALFVWWSGTLDREVQVRWDRLGKRIR